MENNSIINTKVTRDKVVIEIPNEWIINDFAEMVADFKVKGNRKRKFLKEVAEQLEEHIIQEDVLANIYECLLDSENVKYLEED